MRDKKYSTYQPNNPCLRFLFVTLFMLVSACGGGAGGSGGPSRSIAIVTQPDDVSVFEGQRIDLSVLAESDYFLRYQWYRNDVSLSGRTSATLSIPGASLSDAGSYRVEVSNSAATLLSSRTAVVVVSEPEVPPSVVTHPVSIERAEADKARFSVGAKGLSPLAYQWRKNGVAIPGANLHVLEVTGLNADDAGLYSVVVSNSLGEVTSNPAELTVVKQRATGIWYGLVDGDALAHMIVPPSGEMLLLQFAGDENPFQAMHLGRVHTREWSSSMGTLWVQAGSANRVQFFGEGHEDGNYYLRIPDSFSYFYPRDRLEVNLRYYANVSDTFPMSEPRSSLVAYYQVAASERNTSLNSLAATWLYLDDNSEPLISITLNASGQITGDSFYGETCALSGQLTPVEGSTSLFQATLLHGNRGGSCSKTGFEYQGYVFIAPGASGNALVWYLYIKDADDVVGFYYLPLKQ